MERTQITWPTLILGQVTPMPFLHQLITVYGIGPCSVLSSPGLGRGINIELTLLGLMHETAHF